MMNLSSSKNPKSFIGEIGMDIFDVETIKQIQEHDQPSIMSEDETNITSTVERTG